MRRISRRTFIATTAGIPLVASTVSALAGAPEVPRAPRDVAEIWVTNRSAHAAERDAVAELGLPLAPGFARSDAASFAVYDGATLLVSQTDNHSTDLSGNLRWCMLTVLVPMLAPGETKRLRVRLSDHREAGPGLSPEAIAAAIPDCIVEVSNLLPGSARGTLLASMVAGLAADPTWNPARPCLHGAWRRGPVCTQYVVSVPLGGSAPHPSLRAWFHVAAYTRGASVVNARVGVVLENGLSRVNMRDNRAYFYDLAIRFGVQTVDFPAMALGAVDIDGDRVSRVSGAFTPEHNGLAFVGADQSWAARIVTGGQSSGQARATLYGSVPNGRGQVDVRNVAHSPYTRFIQRLWLEPPQIFSHLALPGWEGPRERALGAYCRATRMIQNFSGEIDAMSMDPLEPVAWRPFATTSVTHIGHFTRSQGAPGDNPDIGAHPSYYLSGLFNHSPSGLRLITDHADARFGAAAYLRSAATGQFHRPDEIGDLALDSRWGRNHVGQISGIAVANQIWRISHWGAMFYIPYLLTGDFAYCEGLVAQNAISWLSARFSSGRETTFGSGMTRHDAILRWPSFYDTGIGNMEFPQPREASWAVRTTVHTLGLLPDAAEPSLIGWDKAMAQRLWANVEDTLHRVYVVNSVGPGRRWTGAANEVTRLQSEGAPATPTWMEAMGMISWAHGAELGVLSAQGLAFLRWQIRGRVGPLNDPKFNPDYMIGLGDWMFTKDGRRNGPPSRLEGVPMHPPGQGAPARTAEEVYTATVVHLPNVDLSRMSPCTALDPSSGRAVARLVSGQRVLLAISRPIFLEPFGWYAGKNAKVANASLTIERVLSSSEAIVVPRADAAPGQASPDGGWPDFRPCFPPPGSVPRGQVWAPSPDANSDWAGYHCDVCAHGADLGIPGAREAWDYLITLRRRSGGPGRYYWGFKHSIEPR
jgi:hypothetical protein